MKLTPLCPPCRRRWPPLAVRRWAPVVGLLFLLPAPLLGAGLSTDLDRDGALERTLLQWEGDGSLRISITDREGSLRAQLGICPCVPAHGPPSPLRFADLDADGFQDLVLGEELLATGQALAAHLGSPAVTRSLTYLQVWDTGNELRNVWDAEVDDLDQDGKREIMAQSYHYPGTLVHLYECTGDNAFSLVWHADTLFTPSLNAICGGETDGDGQREAIAGEVGSLGRVYLWENVGDDLYEQRPLGISMQPYEGAIKDVITWDGDGDGRKEIVVATGSVDGGAVAIFEHSGEIGENTYTQVYVYETVSYVFGIEVGDGDHDGNQEVILNIGGWAGSPLYLRRLEYNPALQTYEHKMTEPGPLGLLLSADVGDVDGDGLSELIVGAGIESGAAIYVLEAIADDLFTLAWSSGFYIPGTPLDISIGPLNEYGYPTIASSSFEGQIDIVGYNGETYQRHLDPPIHMAGPVRSLDHALVDYFDTLEDLVPAVSGEDRVYLYEREDASIVRPDPHDPAIATAGWPARAYPNPFRNTTRLAWATDCPAGTGRGSTQPLRILDSTGRVVRSLRAEWQGRGEYAIDWDGTGTDGRRLAGGIYYLHPETSPRAAPRPVVLLR